MTDHAAFLRAILAKPDDDLPRLIYADYLDGELHGEQSPYIDHARAEFIRCQIKLAEIVAKEGERGGCYIGGCAWTEENALKCCPKCRVFCPLRCRERELRDSTQATHVSTCQAILQNRHPFRLIPWSGNPDGDFEYHRGFVESITCSWEDWRTHADAIRAATPLRKVKLTTDPIIVTQAEQVDWVQFGAMAHTQGALELLYPGIEFELPQPVADPVPSRAVQAARRRIQEAEDYIDSVRETITGLQSMFGS